MATIKGKWLWNEKPSAPTNYIDQSCSFESNGVVFAWLKYEYEDLIERYCILYSGGEFSGYVASYDYENEKWFFEAYRTVDFGETEQTVDDNFYTWFTANATEIKEKAKKFTKLYIADIVNSNSGKCFKKLCDTPTVSGKYSFNATLSSDVAFDQSVNFASYSGTEYARLVGAVGGSTFALVGYKNVGASVTFYNTSTGFQFNPSPMDFGETEQIVSDAFYTWLQANATKVS